jgi:hypothetical protein
VDSIVQHIPVDSKLTSYKQQRNLEVLDHVEGIEVYSLWDRKRYIFFYIWMERLDHSFHLDMLLQPDCLVSGLVHVLRQF